jgi:uncharacterized OB-fold protein
MTATARPTPIIDDSSRPFWEASREGRLAIQRCQDCGYYNHPPRQECDRCMSHSLQFEPVSGNGTIFTFTVNHQPTMPGFDVPHLVAMIELDEQQRLLLPSDMPDVKPEDVRIGRRVKLTFERISEDVNLPQFTLAEEEESR